MSMFTKDRLYGGKRLDQEFQLGESFILWGIEVMAEPVPTEWGEATKTLLDVSRVEAPDERVIVGTLASAIADKAKDAEPSDFPAIVTYEKVTGSHGTDAQVISFVGPYDEPTTAKAKGKNAAKSEDAPF
jgi:hypothetical protein